MIYSFCGKALKIIYQKGYLFYVWLVHPCFVVFLVLLVALFCLSFCSTNVEEDKKQPKLLRKKTVTNMFLFVYLNKDNFWTNIFLKTRKCTFWTVSEKITIFFVAIHGNGDVCLQNEKTKIMFSFYFFLKNIKY
jgi:hypothetical protein